MRGITHRGFTVVEVMLFLAISGLLLIIAFAGTGVAIERARFQDASRQTQAHLQSYYSDTLNGVSFRPDTTMCNPTTGVISLGTEPLGTSKCYLLGIVAVFPLGSSEIKSYYVVGNQPPDAVLDGKSVNAQLKEYQPVVVQGASTERSFELPWRSKIVSGCYAADELVDASSETNYASCVGTDAANALLLLRAPETGELKQFVFYTGASDGSFTKSNTLQKSGAAVGYIDFTPIDPNDTAERPLNICMRDANDAKTTIFRIGGRFGATQASVTAAIDVDSLAVAGACL